MNAKKTLPALALALALLFSVSVAMAQPKAKAAPPQAAISQISPEDQAAMKTLWSEHRLKMDPISEQLWVKKMEYDALVANPNSKHADIKAVIEDMRALKAQQREERQRFADAMDAKGFDCPGRHMMGGLGKDCPAFGGHGYGHGGQMMGKHQRGAKFGHYNWADPISQ